MANPCLEWFITDIACMGSGIVTVGLLENEPESMIYSKIKQLDLKYICVDSLGLKKIDSIINGFQDSLELQYIICFDNLNDFERKKISDNGLNIIYFDDFYNYPLTPFIGKISPTSICMLSYTSGTTGAAKLVKLSHEALMSSFSSILFENYKIDPEDVYISYTNLALFGEKLTSYMIMIYGCSIGISNDIKNDIRILQPTLMIAVPRVLDFFYNIIQGEISSRSGISEKIFNKALNKNLEKLSKGKPYKKNFWDRIIFHSIRERFGEKIRYILTGSSLPNIYSMNYLKACLGCEIIEGYGLVETGYSNLCSGIYSGNGYIGGPFIGIELKLEKINNLLLFDADPETCGELCIRNTMSTIDYIDENSCDNEGWFKTGDIFRIIGEKNAFQFIDRISSTFSVKSGWTITPQRIENIYRRSPWILQILVYADSRIDALVAIVVPNEQFIMENWAPVGVKYVQLHNNVMLGKVILKNLLHLAKSQNLKKYEYIDDIFIEIVPWTSNEYITSSLKLKRFMLLNLYKQAIEEMLEKLCLKY